MRLSIYDLDTGEDIVYDQDALSGSTQDHLSIQAGGMGYGLAEAFAAYRYGEEES
jgi:hypothetical protein